MLANKFTVPKGTKSLFRRSVIVHVFRRSVPLFGENKSLGVRLTLVYDNTKAWDYYLGCLSSVLLANFIT